MGAGIATLKIIDGLPFGTYACVEERESAEGKNRPRRDYDNAADPKRINIDANPESPDNYRSAYAK